MLLSPFILSLTIYYSPQLYPYQGINLIASHNMNYYMTIY